MSTPKGFRIADLGGESEDVTNAVDHPLYKSIELVWRDPIIWKRGKRSPDKPIDEPCVYAILRSHGSMKNGQQIEYIGLSRNPKSRFANHETGRRIVQKYGQVSVIYACVPVHGRNWADNQKKALEEIEHLLIWATWNRLEENERKLFTLPGMGRNRANAWHIKNVDFPPNLGMPKEIIFPWMIVK